MSLDIYFFNLIHNFARKKKWLDAVGIFCADYLIFILILGLGVFTFLKLEIKIFLYAVFSGFLSRFLINEIIYFFYQRKRPPDILAITPLIKKPSHPAFPSGHTAFLFGIAFSLFLQDKFLGIIFLFLSFIVSLFRIFVGVHWPLDILGGIGSGLIGTFLIIFLKETAFFYALILGIVQGVTEFLPVSSSGHLVLLQKFLGFQEPPLFFDTLIHFATLLAIIFWFRKDILFIFSNLEKRESRRLLFFIILASIPTGVVGFLIRDYMVKVFNSYKILFFGFLFTGLVLLLTKFFGRERKDLTQINWIDALVIGFFQIFSLIPGISRSGMTISAGIFTNLKNETSLKFSFFLAIPLIGGAMILQLFDLNWNDFNREFIIANLVGFVFSLGFGILSLKFLEKFITLRKLYLFAFYCFFLSFLITKFFF